MAKPKPAADRAAAEIQGMREEIKNLQAALADLVDALIAEEKPGPKEIKKLRAFKKKALDGAAEKQPKKKMQRGSKRKAAAT